MNRYFIGLATILLSTILWAQAPNKMSFQTIVRNTQGKLVVNQVVGVRTSILQGSSTGTSVYEETHQKTSNQNGVLTLEIGTGTATKGTYNTIDWSQEPYFLKTELDIKGGTNFTISGVNKFVSVPYSMYSGKTGTGFERVSKTGDSLILNNGEVFIVPGISSENYGVKPTSGSGNNLVDIDGNSYKTVYIGSQLWMAENLKTTKYRDGSTITNLTDNRMWGDDLKGAWCYYNNDVTNNNKYGKLYNWYAISSHLNGNKEVCPIGWHIPVESEWIKLIDFLGGTPVTGGKLKEVGTNLWKTPNASATNSVLFSALPGGNRYDDGSFSGVTIYGDWWALSCIQNGSAVGVSVSYNTAALTKSPFYSWGNGFSVRCVKD